MSLLPAPVATVGPLVVVSLLGVGLAGFGYRLVAHFLRWTGWIGGAALGFGVGWQLLPRGIPTLTPDQQFLWTAGLIIGGAVAGRLLLPVATYAAALVAGFVSTAGAVGVFFIGDPIISWATGSPFETPPVDSTATATTGLDQIVASQDSVVFVLMFVAGIVGALVATRYHTVLIAAGITASGALLLGSVLPLWQRVLAGSATLVGGVSGVSLQWTAVALVAGVMVQVVDARRSDGGSRSSLSGS